MQKKLISVLLVLVLVLGMLPGTIFAAGTQDSDPAPQETASSEAATYSSDLGKVRVIVENNTYSKADGAPWEGTLVDTWVDLTADSTMMGCVGEALGADSGITADTTYINTINGLSAFDGGSMSGWMGTLNDWFTNEGFSAYTVASNQLSDGDEIRIQYTCNGYGADLGGDFSVTSKKLKDLTFSAGTLSPDFASGTNSYTLTVGYDVKSLTVTPTAENRLFQVHTFVGDTHYKRTASIPVQDGMVITVVCGRSSWPTMGDNSEPEETYTVTVKQEGKVPTANVTIRSQMEGGYLHGLQTVEVPGNLAEQYGFTDNVSGVSALDVLVEAHILTFGTEDFTPATAKEYLDVGSTGWVSFVFGYGENFGFFINQGYPNDGTESPYGGYNGTFITDTAVRDGDTVDFFVYGDGDTWSDYYTWINTPSFLKDGEEATVTVKGFYAVSAYLYKDAASLKAAAKPLEGVQLGWLNPSTGAVKLISGAVTDENGSATFSVSKDTATGYLVAASYGKDNDRVYAIMNPTAKVPVLSGVNVEFKGLHSAQLADLKVYSYQDGQKTGEDLLSDQSSVADGYKLKYVTALTPGDYLVEGYDANGDFNGSIVVTVSEEGSTFTLQRAYQIYATNSGWVAGTDYSIDYVETASNGTKRLTALGSANNYGTVYTSALFLEGDSLKVTLTPMGDKADEYLPAVISKTASDTTDKGALSLYASIPAGLDVKITAPAGSTIVTGTFGNYYTYTFIDPVETVEHDDNTVTATFRVPTTNLNHFLRVQNPDGVTYWSFAKWTAAQDITITRDDLHMDDDISSSTVYRFGNNVYDRADLYMNVNRQGYKNMAVGESFELDTFRNWQAIENFMNSQIALPDTHYQVLDLNGQPSDLLTITPDAHNSALATVTANREGTAIVLVTYDAMTHAQAMSSTDSKVLSAIWPESTGVFVVSVGADGSSIVTNMNMERFDTTGKLAAEKLAMDAEHDILFYLGSQGASYTFTPENGCTVTVARSAVGSAMTFSGFTSEGVSVDAETGAVTLTGLTTGRHIVRIEKDGVSTYQVITARQVSYDLLDAEGNVLPENTEFKPGDTVTIQFHDLLSPKEKLSGVYNHNFAVYYQDANGKAYQTAAGGWAGVYDFNGNPARQKLTVTIPEDVTDVAYVLNGAIKIGGFGGLPTHRGVSYTKGMDRQWGTSAASVLSQLPELTIKMTGYAVDQVEKKIDAIGDVTLNSEEAITAAREAYEALTEEQKAKVSNYKVLTAAEAALEALKKAEQAEIDTVEAKIDAIGNVTLDSEGAITAARAAYDALSVAQKARVENYAVLTAAEAKLAALKRTALLSDIYTTTGDYLASLGTPSVGSIGGEWMALGLARSGRTVPDGYYDAVVEYVQAHADANERLHRSKSTDNSRLILALTAIGKDVTNVGGHDLLKGLDNMAYIQKQGINGPIFALIALDSHNYPASGDVTREKLVQVILDSALENGGWALSGTAADVDMTAMAIQALAPYYADNAAVKAAVDKALDVISNAQLPTGGFASWGSENSESCAQVIVALTALGIDPATDSRFVKDGLTVLDALAGFFVDGGGFRHVANGDRDGMATEQGYYALAAYARFVSNFTRLYDMSDVEIKKDSEPTVPTEPSKPTEPTIPGTVTPATGDSENVTLLFVLFAVALLGCCTVPVILRKKH